MTNDLERLQLAQWILERQLGWIATTDIKIGVVVTIQAAMAGGLATALGAASQKTEWAMIWTISAFVCAIGAFVCAAVALYPRTDGPSESLIFFGRIVDLELSEYVSRLRSSANQEVLDDCASQIHRNAEVACHKHHWVKNSMIWSFLGAPPWVIALLLLVPNQLSK